MTSARSLAVAVVAAGLFGCSAAPSVESGQGEVSAERDTSALYAASSAIWPTTTIPVCWVNGSPELAAQMEWSRDAVAGTWEAVSAIRFVGWGPCQGNGPGVRILIGEENPYSYLGTQGNNRPHSMLLNLTFNTWSAEFCQANLEFCVRTIAVHEFGHALAFDHEQNRPDSPDWCQQDTVGGGDTLIGPWDLDSVMNYCNPEWSGNGTLSEIDIQGVRQVYGEAPAAPPSDPGPEPEPQPEPEPEPDPAADDGCGGLTFEGECQGDTVAWCENGPQSIDCASIGRTCGWDEANGFYNCI